MTNFVTILDLTARTIQVFNFINHSSTYGCENGFLSRVGGKDVREMHYVLNEWDEDEDDEVFDDIQEYVGAPIEGPGEYYFRRDFDGGDEHRMVLLVTKENPVYNRSWPGPKDDQYVWESVIGHLQVAYNLII